MWWTIDDKGNLVNLSLAHHIYIQKWSSASAYLLADFGDDYTITIHSGTEQECIEKRRELIISLFNKGN